MTSRDQILDAVAATLVRQKRSANEMQALIEDSGVSFSDVAAAFDDTDAVLLALVERTAREVTDELDGEVEDWEALVRALERFAERLQRSYASDLVGLHRVLMTESSRRKGLRERFYRAGPDALAGALTRFLESAKRRGYIAPDNCALAAEQFMGMLREPLYRELSLQATNDGGAVLDSGSSVRVFLDGVGGVHV